MKGSFLIAVLTVSSISVANCQSAKAQEKPSDEQAITTIKKFYTTYITEWLKLTNPIDLTGLNAIPKQYCTAILLSKINARFEKGYVNYDPFTFAQDVDELMLKTLSVNKDSKKVNSYTVSYRYTTTPRVTEKQIIHLTVVKQGEKFKIASIR